MQYELTDRLSLFLSGRKPVHSVGEHYLVPNVSGRYIGGRGVGRGEREEEEEGEGEGRK